MKDEYISISEFAKRAGVSVQAVYKRLDKDFKPWLKVENGRKALNIKALEIFKGEKNSTEVESIEAILRMVSMLEKELEIKNEQIRSRDRQIEDLSERLRESHLLLNQQQHLHAADLLETKIEEQEQPPKEQQKQEGVDLKEEKNWWQFWK